MDFLTTSNSQFSRPRLLLILLLALKIKADVNCQAGVFALGFPGNVICDFGTIDIKKEKHNFNVVQYSYLGSGDSGNYVLLCNWIPNSENLECTVKDGYTFDRQVNTRLTLSIPDVTESMGGMYVCQLVPDNGVPVSTCNLTVTAATTSTAVSGATSIERIATEEGDAHSLPVIAFAVMGCFIALSLSLAITLLCLWKKYRLISRTDGPGRDEWGNICCHKKPSKSEAEEEASKMIDELGPNDKCVSTDDDYEKELDAMKKALDKIKSANERAVAANTTSRRQPDASTLRESDTKIVSEDQPESSQPTHNTALDSHNGLKEACKDKEPLAGTEGAKQPDDEKTFNEKEITLFLQQNELKAAEVKALTDSSVDPQTPDLKSGKQKTEGKLVPVVAMYGPCPQPKTALKKDG